jgi:hypothetical protein
MSPRGAARWTSWSRSRTCAGGIRASGGRRSAGSVRKPTGVLAVGLGAPLPAAPGARPGRLGEMWPQRPPRSAPRTRTAGPCTPPRRGDRGFDVRRWRCAVPRGSRRARSSRSTLRACCAGLGAGRDRAGARQLTNRADPPRVRGPVGGQPGPAGAPSVRTWGKDCGGPPCSIVPPPARSPLAEKIRRRRSRSLGAMADAPARGGHLYAEPAPLPCGSAIARSAATWA